MAFTADIKLASSRSRKGGGLLYLVDYDAAKDPYLPHASLSAAVLAAVTALPCVNAPAADTFVPVSFGSTGDLNIDILAKSAAAEEKAFSALAANSFTIAALTTGRAAGCIVKLKSATDYTATEWKPLGYLGGTTFRDNQPSEDNRDERNALIGAFAGDRVNEFQTNLKQSGKDEIDFVTREAAVAGKYYAAKYVVDCGADGQQIIVARKVQIVPQVELVYGNQDRVIGITAKILVDGTNLPYVIYEG